MTTFIKFSPERKAMIAHLKHRLMTEKPRYDKIHGTKYHTLGLEDYAVYAALRGANLTKCDHLNGAQLKPIFKRLYNLFDPSYFYNVRHAMASGRWSMGWYIPADMKIDEELLDMLLKIFKDAHEQVSAK